MSSVDEDKLYFERDQVMKNLIIVGAGGCGREVLQWAMDVNKVSEAWRIKGFLDDSPEALDGKNCKCGILGSAKDYQIQEDDVFVCAIGSSEKRRKTEDELRRRGARFITLIHPTAIVADNAEIGEGSILYPYSVISANAKIGISNIINMHSVIGHDSVLGDYCTISPHCDVTGRCTIGDNVFMGVGAKIIPSTKVGNDAFICAGSVVMTKIRDGARVMGCPARKYSVG